MLRLLSRRIYRGEFYIDLSGLIIHGLVGLVAGLIGGYFLLSVTISYLLYQYMDYIDGEEPKEVQGDIVEFLIGAFTGSVCHYLFI